MMGLGLVAIRVVVDYAWGAERMVGRGSGLGGGGGEGVRLFCRVCSPPGGGLFGECIFRAEGRVELEAFVFVGFGLGGFVDVEG